MADSAALSAVISRRGLLLKAPVPNFQLFLQLNMMAGSTAHSQWIACQVLLPPWSNLSSLHSLALMNSFHNDKGAPALGRTQPQLASVCMRGEVYRPETPNRDARTRRTTYERTHNLECRLFENEARVQRSFEGKSEQVSTVSVGLRLQVLCFL
jgi:hypothetical protein